MTISIPPTPSTLVTFPSPSAPAAPRLDLGPKQLAWCRENLRPFDRAWLDAQAAREHTASVREIIGAPNHFPAAAR